jgi:hypothetical protein
MTLPAYVECNKRHNEVERVFKLQAIKYSNTIDFLKCKTRLLEYFGYSEEGKDQEVYCRVS